MQVAFDFANRRITVEGEGDELVKLFALVKDVAPQLPTITFVATGGSAGATNGVAPASIASPSASHDFTTMPGAAPPTMREFIRGLSLTSMAERITAIAYYQSRFLSTPTFSPKEMGNWFTQCGLEKPNQMSVSVHDAKKRNGYIENAGHGVWRITTQGENFVVRRMQRPPEG
jgi:hypothetical protein